MFAVDDSRFIFGTPGPESVFLVAGFHASARSAPARHRALAIQAAARPRAPLVILIDALDECAHDGKNDILQCIQRHFHKLPKWVGVYMTTRPEAPITEALNKFTPWELVPESDDNRNDVRLFFGRLLARHGGARFADEGVRAAAVEAHQRGA